MGRTVDEAQVDVPRVKDDDTAQGVNAPGGATPREERAVVPSSSSYPEATDNWSGLRHRNQPSAEPEVGSPPGYQLLTPIGVTAYGRAFRARHVEKGREVAIHFLTIDDGLGRELPLAVAKVAQLSKRNVIALEGHGRLPNDGAYYLVTEALEGASLADQLEDEQTFTLSKALNVALEVGRAVRTAHKLGIVHGALSPANVRLTDHGARVVGFGSTAFRAERASHSDPPSPYAAPEVARGAVPDVRSDMYSVGCLIYRMLTGKPPKLMPGEPPPSLALSSVDPVPRELDELVSSCLEALPDARLGDTLLLTRKLREILRSVGDESALARLAVSDSSVPPTELSLAEGEVSGSIFGAEGSGYRSGFWWIVAGLALALAAVWLVWHASVRLPPDAPRTRELR